jgi:cell division protein ZapA (FtsZ GTPase activity inhibitor)
MALLVVQVVAVDTTQQQLAHPLHRQLKVMLEALEELDRQAVAVVQAVLVPLHLQQLQETEVKVTSQT